MFPTMVLVSIGPYLDVIIQFILAACGCNRNHFTSSTVSLSSRFFTFHHIMDDAEAKRRQEEMEKREEARLARSLGKPRAVVAKPHKPSATTGATQTLTKPAATPKPAAVPCAAANPVRGGSSQPTLSPEAESAQVRLMSLR